MTMRTLAFILSLQVLSHCNTCTGFSLTKTPRSHVPNHLSRSALCATNDAGRIPDFQKKGPTIAVALALGWALGSSPSVAMPPSTAAVSITGSVSSSFVVADNYADFSLPSYADVRNADINTNLKGDKQLFGEEAIARASSPSGAAAAAPAAAQKKEPSADDLKAEKAAKKAAIKAARDKQLAAAEKAALDKMTQ